MENQAMEYVCRDSGKFYSVDRFSRDPWCNCCSVARRLQPVTEVRDDHEESWADYAHVAD